MGLCDVNSGEEYRGLDSNRDTEAEVETAVRFFPNVLSREGGRYNRYPVIYLTFMIDNNDDYVCNARAVSFVHVLARLAIEFGSFQENERGGLLVDNGDSLNSLVFSSHSSYGEGHNRTVDDVFVAEMIRLRQMGLLVREDIQEYEPVHVLCAQEYFAENRFRFLVEWNPASLTRTNRYGSLPLHNAANGTLRSFRIVFDYGISYYPMMEGISILFQKDDFGETPIQVACKRFERNDVMDVVKETLARYSPTTPINNTDALLLAAIDERIHLDCVYFLLRRVPDVLIRMVQVSTSTSNAKNGIGCQDNGIDFDFVYGGSEEGGIDDDDNDHGGTKNRDDGDGDGDKSEDGNRKNGGTSKDATNNARKRKRI